MKKFAKKLIYFLNEKFSVKTYLVIGDSHVLVFKHKNFLRNFPFKKFNVCSVGRATISGLENPNSKTQAMKKFLNCLNKRNYDGVIVNLGEVDTGFVIWYRANKYSENVEIMLGRAIKNYKNFLLKIKKNYTKNLIVLSTPLPTIDDESKGEVVNARKEINVSQFKRTKLTLKFNKEMEKFCKENELIFINLDSESLDDNGIVKQFLKNKNIFDHHYDYEEYSKLIIKHLKGLI